MARKIVITSGKGGVGKTTLTANLGVFLAKLGARVVMIDLDIGLNNLDVVMNVEKQVTYDIMDVIENKCRLKQALINDERAPSLYILPSNHMFNQGKVNSFNLKGVIDVLAQTFDYVLIDCPAGIDSGFHRAVYCADEAIVVTTPHISAIRDADKVISVLQSYNLNNISFIINRMRGDLQVRGEILESKKIAELLRVNLLGIIPDDDDIALSISTASAKDTQAYKALSVLANNLHNNKQVMFDCTHKFKGFFGMLRRNIKRKL